MTASAGAEDLVSSRSLTYLRSIIKDDIPLISNHFLIEHSGGEFVANDVDDSGYDPIKCWRQVQELVKPVFNSWIKEWLLVLNASHKWFNDQRISK